MCKKIFSSYEFCNVRTMRDVNEKMVEKSVKMSQWENLEEFPVDGLESVAENFSHGFLVTLGTELVQQQLGRELLAGKVGNFGPRKAVENTVNADRVAIFCKSAI